MSANSGYAAPAPPPGPEQAWLDAVATPLLWLPPSSSAGAGPASTVYVWPNAAARAWLPDVLAWQAWVAQHFAAPGTAAAAACPASTPGLPFELTCDLALPGAAGPARVCVRQTLLADGSRLLTLLPTAPAPALTAQALRSAAERVALVTRAAGVGTWELDLQTGSARWDEQMWRLRGLEPRPGALSEIERLALVHPDDRERVLALSRSAQRDQGSPEFEFRVVWPDGQVRWIASRSQVVRDEEGLAIQRIGVNWDSTEAREAAAMRHEHEMARRESQAKSRFMARMSHELRTPLNAVLGFTQLLLAEETGSDAAARARRERLQHVQGSGLHLLALVNDVLDLASLDSGELRVAREPVPLLALLQATLPMMEPLCGQHAIRMTPPEVDADTGAQTAMVWADTTRLRQVLVNLLGNAIKYSRPGGQVRLNLGRSPNADGAASDDWVLAIADTGPGLDEQQQRQLFEPFNHFGAEHTAAEASGIGLTIAKSLVERMGGQLRLHSAPGAGSVFAIALPAADEPAWLKQPPASGLATADGANAVMAPSGGNLNGVNAPGLVQAEGRPRGLRHRVLYIEDNPVNAMIVAELLSRRPDVELHIAENGTRGVAQAQTLLPTLVLLDMQLPDFNGLEVMRRLQADPATARLPCVVLSANAMPDDIERALRAGARAYWTKPLDFAAFLRALDGLLGTGSQVPGTVPAS